MDLERLFEILDIEEIEDFRFFDNFAALVESDESIDYEEIYYIISNVDREMLSEIINDYFEDMLGGVPDAETEIYMLISNIRSAMKGLCDNNEDENSLTYLCEEILKFRNWYNFDADVVLKNKETGETDIQRLKDALFTYRMEKMNGESYSYGFEGALNYELEEYIISLGSDNINDEYDYTSGREEEALLESDYLIDDEFSDEY